MICGAILASGRGSNAANLIILSREESLRERLSIACLIADNPAALVLERAKEWNVPSYCIPRQKMDRVEHEKKILQQLAYHKVDWVFLAGYKRLLTKHFLSAFTYPGEEHARVVNIHPSLLPDFPGLNAYQRAFAAGGDYSGVTVHLVDEGTDTGAMICQERFERKKGDTLEEFMQRGLKLEHKLYRRAVRMIIEGRHLP